MTTTERTENRPVIRPVKMTDAEDIHRLRVMAGVFENLLATPDERLESVEEFLKAQRDPALVAETSGHVVGMAALEIPERARIRHRAELGLMVHRDYQGQGIGRALLAALLDIADNWLMLKRVGLRVFTDNERAVRLYKSFGFVIEGTERYGAIKNGVCADLYLMARYLGETGQGATRTERPERGTAE